MCALPLLIALAGPAAAEQKVAIGDFEAHYVVFPSAFLDAKVTALYGIRRSRDLSILNLSVLDAQGKGARVQVAGQVKNLLGQLSALDFREIREKEAVYYIAEVRHTNREVLRFSIAITPPETATYNLEFQQEVFWDE